MVVLHRRPARALQIQRQILAANHWTEHRVHNVGVGRYIGGTGCGCLQPHGKNNNVGQPDAPGSQGLSHQLRGTHGSSQKSGREMPCQASVGGDVLGPVKAQ